MIRRRSVLYAATGTVVVLAATTTAATYALYSDFDTATGGSATAATVALGSEDAEPPSLTYPPMQLVGEVREGALTVDYRGTVPADVTVSVEPGAVAGLCVDGPGGPQNTPGTTVLVGIGGAAETEYCSFLGGPGATVAEDVPPGSPVTTDITLRLTENTGGIRIDVADVLVVEARGGFTDVVRGTLAAVVDPVVLSPEEQQLAAEVSAAPDGLAAALAAPPARQGVLPIDPALVPPECRDAGMEFRLDQVVQLTPRDRPWVADEVRGAPAEPLLIFGTDGDDEITGSAASDCIVGGDGADDIRGGDGDDVLVGGPAADVLDGGRGADRLVGGAGSDELIGGPGTDRFDGGPDGATCDVTSDDTAVRCAAPVVPAAPPPPTAPTSSPVPAPSPAPTAERAPAPAVPEEPPAEVPPGPDEPGAVATTPPADGTASDGAA
ncbi:calcium-binding protein [Pseudonocardia hydrocarbonoxydans]|uniref:calcium-binding protein n=1 Tax=Pseudonocardia hydrocarbonoxydans TaxID=76726 RepID=UPI001C3FB036|nr:calcium-binding protein [Pseudonocardia hydrocarbonoxydans]